MVTKIMPLGASNTYGMYQDPTSPGGYRGPLQDLLLSQNLSFDFVGLDKDGVITDADHNGYSGKPIDWFTSSVNEGIYDKDGTYSHTVNSGGKPAVQYFIEQAGLQSTDVILLLVGTNDVRLGDSAETMLKEIQVLLDQIVNGTPSPLVQLMKLQPIGGDWWADGDPTRTNDDTIRIFNEGLEALVTSKYGALGVTLVDSGVTTADLSPDGVHMNGAGYHKMATAYYDSLLATKQVDVLPAPPVNGGSGDDQLVGTNNDDVINGYGGNDTLAGELGNDRLSGGDGDDTLTLDAGSDTLDGGSGLDWVKVGGSAPATIDLSMTAAQDTGHGTDTLLNIENALGGLNSDTLLGSEGANALNGEGGDDSLIGRGGNDLLDGGADDDHLDGGAGQDRLLGGEGADTLILDAGNDTLDGAGDSDWVRVTGTAAATIDLAKSAAQSTGYGTDTILNIENVGSGSGADRLYGTSSANVLTGNAGADSLYGRVGADVLTGGTGQDALYGGVDGQCDVFAFTSRTDSAVGSKRDALYEFVSGVDDIDLTRINAHEGLTSDQALGFSGTAARAHSAWYTAGRSEVIVRADVSGDKTADFEIRVAGLTSLTRDDFLL